MHVPGSSLGRLPRGVLPYVILVLALLLVACGGSDTGGGNTAGSGSEGNSARNLFAAKGCAECHGPDGEGADTAPVPLAGTRMIIQQFETRVRNGRGSAMPAHTPDQITDEEIRVLYDWLRGSD